MATTYDPKKAAADAAERIGDGAQLTTEHFKKLNHVELNALYRADPERYRALRDGRTPGQAWTPEATR